MAKFSVYYPNDVKEEAYMRWLEAPGEGLAQVLGAAPSIEEVLARGVTLSIRKSRSPLLVLDLAKANKPYGHVAYTRRTKSGKLVTVGAKGTPPAKPSDQGYLKFKPQITAAPVTSRQKAQQEATFTLAAKNPFNPKKNKNDYLVWNELSKHKPKTEREAKKIIHAAIKQLFNTSSSGLTNQVMHYFQENGAFRTGQSWGNTSEPANWKDDDLWLAPTYDEKPAMRKLKKRFSMTDKEAFYAAAVVRGWADWPTTPKACHLRGVIARAGGLPIEQEIRALKKYDTYYNSKKQLAKALVELKRAHAGKEPPPAAIAAHAIGTMIKASQKAHGGDGYVVLHRGVSKDQAAKIRASKGRVSVNVLSSWTTNRDVAETFALGGDGGVVVTVRVPVSSIILSHKAVPGLIKSEFEVIIASAGEIQADTWHSDDDKHNKSPKDPS